MILNTGIQSNLCQSLIWLIIDFIIQSSQKLKIKKKTKRGKTMENQNLKITSFIQHKN